MQFPIVALAPVVQAYTQPFRSFFTREAQFKHFQEYVTGLIVLDNKSYANIARCILKSADKTNISRFLSESPWSVETINALRIAELQKYTQHLRKDALESFLVIDDTLCTHVGTVFEFIDRHYDHNDHSFPVAHNIVTSHYVSGVVRFPVDWRIYRRYEELTDWEHFVHKHFPDEILDQGTNQRIKQHKRLDPVLMCDPAFAVLHEQFRSKITLAQELCASAVHNHGLSYQCALFDSWYLTAELVNALEKQGKEWISIVKKNRTVETQSFTIYDDQQKAIVFDRPTIPLHDLVPLIPKKAYRPVTIGQRTYYCFPLSVRMPSLGRVRLVISFPTEAITGTCALFATRSLRMELHQVLTRYLQRWPIETFYQEGKQLLGLDAYRMRDAQAIAKHWCLVFAAYSFLHLDSLLSPLKQRSTRKTIGEVCRQQQYALIEACFRFVQTMIEQGSTLEEAMDMLFHKQKGALALSV